MSSLLPGSFSRCCLILSSSPTASAPWYWSMRTLLRKNRNVGVAEMLLVAAVPCEQMCPHECFRQCHLHHGQRPHPTNTHIYFICYFIYFIHPSAVCSITYGVEDR